MDKSLNQTHTVAAPSAQSAADRVAAAFDRELSRSILAARESVHQTEPTSVFDVKPTTVFPRDK